MFRREGRVLLRHYLEQGALKAEDRPSRRGWAGGRSTVDRDGWLNRELDAEPMRHGLVVVLGYSRMLWLQYYERQTMETVVRGLEAAFAFFGRVPLELLFNQMRAVAVGDHRREGGRLLENREFLRFSTHWGFRIRACRAGRAQTKGKVERPISYVRSSFFYGREFVSDDDLNARARRWLDTVANVRVHGTLMQRPVARFEDERRRLLPLAPRPYRSVVAVAAPQAASSSGGPLVVVERRPLAEYTRIAEVAS